ncbi:LOW QUALITY PROTEIN: hypothetical protein OSB04_002676 [Centaurea solstitialis]|uniref:Peroxisomal membrane protein PMP22 n=1 Tax=Centaurea solstitialis TaxID=347529 RepID=A0AA38U549_9ASTR|nr:LOW QUALITY PROTEIN: hypothetical protein OSB04_002676 [Centaurea solstitialis]
MSIAKKGLQQYLQQLQQHPLRTKALTAGVYRRSCLKSSRHPEIANPATSPQSAFGCAYLGPFGHFYHILLDKLFKGKKDSTTVAKKVLLEQVTSSPWNNLIFMLYYGLVIEGRPWVHVKSKIKKEYPTVQYTAWTFWPAIGWINHRYVPLQFRVILQSFVAMCWGIFLNLRARSLTLTKD